MITGVFGKGYAMECSEDLKEGLTNERPKIIFGLSKLRTLLNYVAF